MVAVLLLLPENGLLRWHKRLVEVLKRDGHDVGACLHPGAAPPAAVALLDMLEDALFSSRTDLLSAEKADAWIRPPVGGAADIVVDLCGRVKPEPGAVFPLFAGAPGDCARDFLLLSREEARIGLASLENGRLLVHADALIAMESPHLFRGGREAVASRLMTLIRALARQGAADGARTAAARRLTTGMSQPSAFLLASLVERARRRLIRMVAHAGHWRIAWRRVRAPEQSVYNRLDWPEGGWTILNDDRRRYFADPFFFAHEGVVHVFCEEYPYATRKGVISWFPLDAEGRPSSSPRIVLERPGHLSYPMVFQHNGAIWMAPESSAGGAFELYRADPFPVRWTRDRVAIDLPLVDATIFKHGERCWLTATTSEDGGSTWDCLSLFAASSPLGPWTRCGQGPTLMDVSCARPAGHIFKRGDEVWRPAQDCSTGYGAGLALCRIDRLDDRGLFQTVSRRLGPPQALNAEGVHTLNATAGFEIIDVVGTRSRWA